MQKSILATVILVLATLPTIALADPITLEVTYSSGAYTSMLEESAKAFEAQHPDIKIEYRSPVVNTYDDLLQLTLRAALVNDLPDISLEGSQNVGILASHGTPVVLDDLIKAEPSWSELGYSPAIQEVGQVGGKTYALAYATSVPTIYLNLDLLRKAGVDTDHVPSDWKGLTEAAAEVQALGGDTVGGLFDYNSTGNWTFQAIVTSLGGNILTDDGSDIAFNGPEGIEALQILHDFGAAGTVDMSQAQMLQAFSAGTVGVFASYSAAIGQIEKQVDGKFDMKAVSWPIPAANGRIPAGGRTVMIYAKDPARQQAAWDFVKFLTGAEGQAILVKGVGAVPVNSLAVTDMLGGFYEQNPNQKPALDAVPRLTKWLAYPGDHSVKVSEIVRDQLRRVLVGHEDPTLVMADIVSQIRPLLPTK